MEYKRYLDLPTLAIYFRKKSLKTTSAFLKSTKSALVLVPMVAPANCVPAAAPIAINTLDLEQLDSLQKIQNYFQKYATIE